LEAKTAAESVVATEMTFSSSDLAGASPSSTLHSTGGLWVEALVAGDAEVGPAALRTLTPDTPRGDPRLCEIELVAGSSDVADVDAPWVIRMKGKRVWILVFILR